MEKIFIEEFFVKLDERCRFKLPVNFYRILQKYYGTSVVLLRMPEPCLSIYPAQIFNKQYSDFIYKIKESTPFSKKIRTLSRITGSGRSEVEIDGQGRISISPAYQAYLGLKASDEIALIGAEDRIEIWRRDSWEQYLEVEMKEYDSILEYFTDKNESGDSSNKLITTAKEENE